MKLSLAFAAVLASSSLVSAAPAGAHEAYPFYYATDANPQAGRWPVSYNTFSVFGSGAPVAEMYSRMSNAMGEWNSRAKYGQPGYTWRGTTTSAGANFESPCDSTYNGIFWKGLGAYQDPAAFTIKCVSGYGINSRTHKGGISMNSDLPFYTGAGTGQSTQWDYWGVLTHELGHLTGWSGHFDNRSDPDLCTGTVTQATMCQGSYIQQANQYAWYRSLETHDVHTWHAAY